MVGLFCAIIGPGVDGSAFPVDIDAGLTVGHLKDEIKKKNPGDLKDIDARKLKLFPARSSGGVWLDSKGQIAKQMRMGRPPKQIKDYMEQELENPLETISKALPELPGDVIHLLVKLPNPSLSPSKRPRLEELDDVPLIDLKDKEFVKLPQALLMKCGLLARQDLMLYCRPQVHELWKFLSEEVAIRGHSGYIVGPPGTGKSACTLSYALSLDREEWEVVWIQLGRKRNLCVRIGAQESWVIKDLRSFLVPRGDDKKLFLFLDGYRENVEGMNTFLPSVYSQLDGQEDRLVICSSMGTLGKTNAEEDTLLGIRHFFMYSWTKEEYVKAIANGEFYESVSSALDATTAFQVNEDDDASDYDAVDLKFYYAGGSCRFMFQYNTATVKEKLEEGVESVSNKADLVKFCTGELHSSSINRLYGLLPDGKKRGRFPVSSYAAALFAKKTGVEVIADLATRLNATENPALDGHILEWLFLASVPRWEVELTGDKGVVDKLPKAGVVTFDPDKRFRKTPDQKILVSKLWLQPVKWNQGGYDAVYFDEGTGCVIFIQVTRSDKHDLKLSFFQTVCTKLHTAGMDIKQVDIFFVVKPEQYLKFHTNHVDDRFVLKEYDSYWNGKEESKVLVRAFRAPSSSVL